MWVFTALFWVIKWGLIIGTPIFLIVNIIVICCEYDNHKTKYHHKDFFKTATMTFENFIKLYPVNSDRWCYVPDPNNKYRISSNTLSEKIDTDCHYLFFKDDTEIPCWSIGYDAFTQIIFKTIFDYLKYSRWIKRRDKAIRNHKDIETQKQDLENMDNILKTIQKDIDKVREEANKQIEEGAKATIDISKQLMENNEIAKLFVKEEPLWGEPIQ